MPAYWEIKKSESGTKAIIRLAGDGRPLGASGYPARSTMKQGLNSKTRKTDYTYCF